MSHSNYEPYYHYTNWSGRKGIQDAGRISMSSHGVMGGQKVYLTRMNPTRHSKREIADVCWGGGYTSDQMLADGRCDHVMEITLRKDDPNRSAPFPGRNIFTYDKDIVLSEHQVWWYKFENAAQVKKEKEARKHKRR